MLRKNKNAQQTLEYLVLVTGVVALLIVFFGPNGTFRASFNRTTDYAVESMQNSAEDVANYESFF